ncbi:MAG: TFIIB-type zinc ribbon-containing protein [Acidimicrobiales bacterium]
MTTLTCPKCGTTFETSATTNTRCRSCRHVVNVPRGGSSAPRRAASNVSRTAVGLVLDCGHPFAVYDEDAAAEADPDGYEWVCFVCDTLRSVRRVVGTLTVGPDDGNSPEELLSVLFDDDDDTVQWDGVLAALGLTVASQ